MRCAFTLLVALSVAHIRAFAQEVHAPSQEPPEQPSAASDVALPLKIDPRAYWASVEAEDAARRAELAARRECWNRVDLRTPRILTLSLLMPAAALLVSAGIKAMVEWSSSSTETLDPYPAGAHTREDHDQRINGALAGAGGLLAVGAIGAGIWWGQRRAERNRLKRELNSELSTARRVPVLGLQLRTDGVGVSLRGRL